MAPGSAAAPSAAAGCRLAWAEASSPGRSSRPPKHHMLKLNNQVLLFAPTVVFIKLLKFKRVGLWEKAAHGISEEQPMELTGDS